MTSSSYTYYHRGAATQAGMLSQTLIAFLSDNGGPSMPATCNGGLRGGKGTSFEGGVRSPAFVHWPACLGRVQVCCTACRCPLRPLHLLRLLLPFVPHLHHGSCPTLHRLHRLHPLHSSV